MAIFISTKAPSSYRNNLVNHNFKAELNIMNDGETHLQEIKDRVLAFAKERDWEQFHAPKNLSMAIAAEAAELMEHFLWQSPEASRNDMEAENLRAKVEEELADVFIFAIEFANMTGIDIAKIIDAKMKRNAEKYPVEKAKGRSVKYTEL
jgi:NTP pyrophosphatase (non-canonical NTP hydrolase)